MKKLRLDLSNLRVESFALASEEGEAGTVKGNNTYSTCEVVCPSASWECGGACSGDYTCVSCRPGYTYVQTCDHTCAETCEESCGPETSCYVTCYAAC